jgi:outer membrane protein OmpA-like peptidoglycan-associated protein
MKSLLTLLFTCICLFSFSQSAQIEGYIYETGNRGYIGGVNITAENIDTEKLIAKAITNDEGFFSVEVPPITNVRIYATKEMYDVKKIDLKVETGKAFIKLEMGRMPGYTFEVTLAEKRDNENIVVDAIKGTRVEVYNNTKRESVMDLKEHTSPEFQLNLVKGNHYTVLIRKEGFLSKRMEAKVNVEGCILCFEGVGSVTPGVADNLTEGNAFGVLLANVEMERIFTGKKMEVQNLYYDINQSKLRADAKQELQKVITLMKDNPNLTLELGAHTDSRGTDSENQNLSERRATSAVDYLIMKGDIAKARIVSKGYGENILLNNCGDGSKCPDAEHAKTEERS